MSILVDVVLKARRATNRIENMSEREQNSDLAARLVEEKLYDIIASEIEDGIQKQGLWLKALANSNGDEKRAKGEYLSLRLQSLKDEIEIAGIVGVNNPDITETSDMSKAKDDSRKLSTSERIANIFIPPYLRK